jgi:WD40 repeat protein
MTNDTHVALHKLAELDGGGARLAVDGARIAAATDDGIILWRDHQRTGTAEAPAAIDRLRFHGGELLAAPYVLTVPAASPAGWATLADLGPAVLHDLPGPPAGQLLVRRADWSADGQEVLVYVEHRAPRGIGASAASGPQARLLWLDRARKVLAVPWTGRTFSIDAVALGARFAAAGGKQLLVWDRRSHAQLATLDVHTVLIRDLAFSSDDRLLGSVANDHKVALVDTATWKPIATWDAHDGDATGIAFHPTLPLVATTGQDGQVRVWSLDGKRRAEAALGRPGNAVAFSPDGKQLVVATDEHVAIFSLTAE